MQLYSVSEGSKPNPPTAYFHLSGPQSEERIPKEIRDLLEIDGIQKVAVYYNHGLGDRIVVYTKIKD